MRLQTFYSEDQVEATIKEHREIFSAIKERNDEKGEQVIRMHYQDGKERLNKKDYYTHSYQNMLSVFR